MTKKQATTLIARATAISLTQILSTAILLRSLDRTRKEATVQASAIDVLEMRRLVAKWADMRLRKGVLTDILSVLPPTAHWGAWVQ